MKVSENIKDIIWDAENMFQFKVLAGVSLKMSIQLSISQLVIESSTATNFLMKYVLHSSTSLFLLSIIVVVQCGTLNFNIVLLLQNLLLIKNPSIIKL